MSGNLSARLKRIRDATKAAGPSRIPQAEGRGGSSPVAPGTPPSTGTLSTPASVGIEAFAAALWTEAAPYVLHRSASAPIEGLPPSLDSGLAILCPSASSAFVSGLPLDVERILLFDLETTGLSGGAGTIAFLAAFGRFEPPKDSAARLWIDQYLLLDYPGEAAFLELVMGEFERSGGEPVLGSYNGRAFDMQILRTRCVMNGMAPPEAAHLDLVHAARRLWRRRLPSCSLGDVERGVLGLDRGEDLSGAEAPDAWFDFLKTGASARLLAIGDHNRKDLEGLAALLVRMDAVARDPESASAGEEVDREGLALRWLSAAKAARLRSSPSMEVARTLLELAVAAGSARAAIALARELARAGDAVRAAALRRTVAEMTEPDTTAGLRAIACAALATDALRRLRDRSAALDWIERALALEGLSEGMRSRLERRRERLVGRPGASDLSPSP